MDVATILKALAAATPVVGALGFLYRRFRRSGTQEVESFARYLTQGLKFYIGRHLRRRLAGELTLRQYARVHLQSTATEMLVPATYPVSLSTDRVFVPLLLRDASRGTIEYQDLVERTGERTVVIGEPGSGKSSLMKRTFRDACRRAIADPAHAPLPILFELRTLGQLLGDQLLDLSAEDLLDRCLRSLEETAIYKNESSALDLQHGGGLLLLLDGLDEVPREASAHVASVIVELGALLARRSANSSLIVSTRTQHYLSMHDRSFEEVFHALSIRPFSNADIYRFLLSWPFERDRARQISRLFTRIRQLPSLSELCTNPLTLAMFIARDQQTEGEASPETRSAFYAALVEEFLVNRRHRQQESPIGRQRLLRQREKILGAICIEHLLDPNEALNSISEQRMLRGVEAADIKPEEAPVILEGLAIETGLFSSEREGQTYRFMHLTFCEFLAATAVVNRGAPLWEKIVSRMEGEHGASDDDWRSRLGEVVAFSAGRSPESQAERILADIRRHMGNTLVLRAALEAQNYRNTDVMAATLEEGAAIAAVPPTGWKVAWFTRLRWLLAVQRDVAAGSQPELSGENEDAVPPPGEYLIDLIDTYGAPELLLGALSRVDVEAAIDIAEESGDDKLVDVVSTGADDFGTLLAILARHSPTKPWAASLVSCALHEPQIAQVLAEIAVDVPGTAPIRRWQEWYVLRGTVYGRLLDEVLARPKQWRPEEQALLDYLVEARVPRRELTEFLRFALPATLLPAVAAVTFVTMVNLTNGNQWWVRSISLVAVIPPIFALTSRLRDLIRDVLLRSRTEKVAILDGSQSSFALDAISRGETTSGRVARVRGGPLRRSAVLEEVVNLRQYRFSEDDHNRADADPWLPGRIESALAGVGELDIRALHYARDMRRRAEEKKSPALESR